LRRTERCDGGAVDPACSAPVGPEGDREVLKFSGPLQWTWSVRKS